nr:retrovirus-related Pol polyprotein from transposon TNT 1-94 [Tanacetum cinerariifolium]
MRSTFRPRVYCTNCSKEGHNNDECYKLKGYPIGHPLHGKYKPPVARSEKSSTSGTDAVFMRMDQLQNQLNQVMLMMQQCQKNPPTGMVNSYTIRKHKFIASVMTRFKTSWVTDSGATYHISILLSVMHDTFLCNPPIHVTPPNGQTVEVKICGKVRIKNDITLTNVFYIPSFADNLLSNDHIFICLLVYVDDIILTGNDNIYITLIKQHLYKEFSIKDLGSLNYYLGIEILRNQTGLIMTQRKYTLELLQSVGLLNVKPSSIPFDPLTKLNHDDGHPLDDPSQYRALVGKLLYFTITRPDNSYVAQTLSQFIQAPRTPHLKALVKFLRYLKSCPGQGLIFQANST